MNQIERIKYYENILNKGNELINNFLEILKELDNYQTKIKELDDYYQSELYRKDLKDDDENKIPKDLPRGILTEDLIYNLLLENDFIYKKVLKKRK